MFQSKRANDDEIEKESRNTMPSQSPDFERIKQTNTYGEPFWSTRDLAPLLGYSK